MRRILGQLKLLIEQHHGALLILVVATVVILGSVYSAFLGEDLRYPDEKDYYALATNLVSQKQFSISGNRPTAYRPPGYPLLLSPLILMGMNVVHIRILNFVALGLSIWLLHVILTIHSSRFVGCLAILLVLCYPVLFYCASTLYPQTVASALFLLVLLFLSKKEITTKMYLLSGFLLGYVILMIPVFIFTLLVFPLWFLSCRREEAKRFVLSLLVALTVVGTWTVRNYLVFGSFVFISSNSGLNLLLGNSENTAPNAGVNVDISKYRAQADKLDEIARDKYFRSKAIEWIVTHKIRATGLYCLKFLNYFNYRNDLATKSEKSTAKDLIMLFTYGPLLLLLVLRILLVKRFKLSPFEILLIVLYFASGFFYAAFFTRIRFRLPFDFLLIGIAAMMLGRLCQARIRGMRIIL